MSKIIINFFIFTLFFLNSYNSIATELTNDEIGFVRSLTLKSLNDLCKNGNIQTCYHTLILEYSVINSPKYNTWDKYWFTTKRCNLINNAEELRQLMFKYYPTQPGLYDGPAYIGLSVFLSDHTRCK